LTRKGSQKLEVNGESLAEYRRSIFIASVARRDVGRGIENEDDVLMMDNRPNDVINEIIDLLTAAPVWIVALMSHTMKIVQFVDLTSFGTFKVERKSDLPVRHFLTTAVSSRTCL
jgi:hypothetical protein